MSVRRVAPVLAVVLLMSCTGSAGQDDDEEVARVSNAAVVAAAIREVVDIPPPSADDSDDTDGGAAPDGSEVDGAHPVVYVFSVAEAGLAAETQSGVVSTVRDDVDVRFADNRDEAIDEGSENAAVIDDGVLLVIGEIPTEGDLVDVAIEVYYDADDHIRAVFTFAPADEETWTVTETTSVSVDAAA